MARDVRVNGIKGPVMKGREYQIIRVDWVKRSEENFLYHIKHLISSSMTTT
jgi:hypothetical protein